MKNFRLIIILLLTILLASTVALGTNVPLGPYFDDTYFDLSSNALILKVVPHEKGGLEADVSAYDGLIKITGGATSNLTIGIADDNIAEIDDADAAADDYCKLTANGIVGRSYSEVRTDLGLVIGTNIQAYDDALASISALTYVSPSFIKLTANDTYAVRTLTEVKTDLALNNVTNDAQIAKSIGTAQGDLIYFTASATPTVLAKGTAAQVLTMNAGATAPEWAAGGGGYTNLTSFVEQTAWRLFYSNTDGDVVELALGADGTYLKSNGAAAAPTFGTPAGAGTVTTSGTPVQYDYARFTGATTIEGRSYTEMKTDLAFSSDDLSDVASIAMLDEAETVTGYWDFTDYLTVSLAHDTPVATPYLRFERRRDGDPTSSVSSGDYLGSLNFMGLFGTFYQGAAIRAIVDGTPGANDMPGRLEFWTTLDGLASPSLRMAIDNAGNIKMGDGVWTNYVNVSSGGVLTLEGTANIEGVDATEFGYVDGVTSAIQTQFGLRYLKTEMDEFSELQAIISDKTLVNTTDKLNVFASITEAELYGVLSDVTLFLEDLVDDTTPELGGEMDAGAHTIGFTQQTVTYNVTTTTVDWTAGNKATVTLTGNVGTLAFTNPTNPCNVLLKIVQDGTGSRLITAYDADVKWAGGTKPTLTTTAAGIDIVSFYFDGTNYYGVASLAFATP